MPPSRNVRYGSPVTSPIAAAMPRALWHIAGNAENARRCVIECGGGSIGSNIVFGGEVEQLVRVTPMEHTMDARLDNWHFSAKHIHKCAVEYRSDSESMRGRREP